MGRTLEMFDKPRRPRRWLMHVCDAGDGPCCCDETPISVRYACSKCGHETGWTGARTVTEARRGVPCPKCNSACEHQWRDDGDRLQLVCVICGEREDVKLRRVKFADDTATRMGPNHEHSGPQGPH